MHGIRTLNWLVGLTVLGCTTVNDPSASLSTSCRSTDTTAEVTLSDVTSVPSSLPTQLQGYYSLTKYLYLSEYQIHIFGTAAVSNWMMVNTYELARNIVGSLQSESSRQLFFGHHIFVITDSDPIVPGGAAGQRNTGNASFTIVNEVLVCATAVDTIRPDAAPEYRAWDTPIHEFGHSVELALDLRATTVELHQNFDPNFNAASSGEYFAWANQNWFDAALRGSCGADALVNPDKVYLSSIYTTTDIWKPTCSRTLKQ